MVAQNELTGPDSILFKHNIFNKLNNGVMHSIPITGSFKIFKHFTWTNSINYTERWYFRRIKEDSIISLSKVNTKVETLKVDTLNGFYTERDFNASSNISTTLYGMYQFKNGFIRAIRHVITPTLGFSYNPYFSQYFDSYTSSVTKNFTYSEFEGGIIWKCSGCQDQEP